MDISTIILHIEALIFASDKPLTTLELTELINNSFGFMDDKILLDQVESAIEGIIDKYSDGFYPFEIKQSGGGWQFLTKKEYHKTVAQLNGEKFLKRLSSASLETLSIIAYKQPVTKGEIESIRGVNSDYSIQKLLEKELIVITGRNEELPGKPLVYATSKNFMDYFGINSADELPRIKEVFAGQAVQPTFINTEMTAIKYQSGIESPEDIQNNESENQIKPREDGSKDGLAEDENSKIDEEALLIIRGNGELIEETFVVNEETDTINPDTMIDGEDNLDDETNQHMKEVLNKEHKQDREAGI